MYTTKQKGFTIVELLIVIVVIAILAAISIVAFTGVQQRGRDSGRASDVSNITKALTAYTADEGGAWPADAGAARSALEGYESANLGEVTNKLQNDSAPSETNRDQYSYQLCDGGNGAVVAYWKENGGEVVNQRAGTCADSDEF